MSQEAAPVTTIDEFGLLLGKLNKCPSCKKSHENILFTMAIGRYFAFWAQCPETKEPITMSVQIS